MRKLKDQLGLSVGKFFSLRFQFFYSYQGFVTTMTFPFLQPRVLFRRSAFWAVLLAVFFVPFVVNNAQAAPQRFVINSMSLVTQARDLFINLSVTVDDEDGLRDMLKNGAVIELSIGLTLERERSWWSNAELANEHYTSLVQHDPLTREFFLMLPGEVHPLRDRNLAQLLSVTWEKLHLKLSSMDVIEKAGLDKSYKAGVTVGLRYKEVPPWLASSSIIWAEEIVPPVTFTLGYRYQ